MKTLLFFLLLAASPIYAEGDFETFMGKGMDEWQHVQRRADIDVLSKYRSLYEKNRDLQYLPASALKIPQVIHFIWLGPRGYPAKSVENIRTWKAQNPDWTIKFWTDRDRPLPCSGMVLCRVQDFPFKYLKPYYEKTQNWAQKSDILRYEILFQEGGVYVDHDANCLQPFDQLHSSYDLYACLELPHEPHCNKAVTCGIGIVGSRPGHPVLKRAIEWVAERWDTVMHSSSTDRAVAVFQDSISRTYMPFTLALEEKVDAEGNTDIVFPSAYFYAKGALPSIYSKHFYAGSWLEKPPEQRVEKIAINGLAKIKKEIKSASIISLLILLFSLSIVFYVLFVLKRRIS